MLRAIIGLDLEDRVHSVWNPAAEKMLGWGAQDVASEARYIDLNESVPDMYVSINARTATIEQYNRTLMEALGRLKEELIGRPVFEICHPDCLEQAKEIFKKFLESGEIRDKELQLQ